MNKKRAAQAKSGVVFKIGSVAFFLSLLSFFFAYVDHSQVQICGGAFFFLFGGAAMIRSYKLWYIGES